MALKASEECPFKELGSYSSLSSFLPTVIRNSLRNLFSSWGVNSSICLVSPFKTRNSWNRSTSCLVFFLVFSFSCPSINSSTDESRLWKRLVWFEAIFLNKNAPKLLEVCYLQANQRVDTSFFTCEKKWYDQSAGFSSATKLFFYLHAFWRVNLGIYIIILFISFPSLF